MDRIESLPSLGATEEGGCAGNSTPARILPDISGGKCTPLRIDAFLSGLGGARKKISLRYPLDVAKQFARRGLEIGYWASIQAETQIPGPAVADFDALQRLANKAAKALGELIDHFQPGASAPTDLQLAILTTKIQRCPPLPQQDHLQAAKDASVLWETRELARRIEKTALDRSVRIRRGRHNPGKPADAAFLKELAEIWIYLTGNVPSSNMNPDKNQFLRFAQLGWTDVFDPEEKSDPPNFIGALRKLHRPKIGDVEVHRPAWL